MGGKIYTNKELLAQFKEKYPDKYDDKFESQFENTNSCTKCFSNAHISKLIYVKSRVSPLFEYKLHIMGEIGNEEGPRLYCRKCNYKFFTLS